MPFSGNGERGNTPLQEAASGFSSAAWTSDVADTVSALLGYGANYDIFSACGMDDLEWVRELAAEDAGVVMLEGGADMTPLHWAARSGSSRCVQWLLQRGADVDAKTVTDRTPLHLAAERGNVDAVWVLAENGADLDAQDKKGRTPLHRAAYEGKLAAAEALMSLGADRTLETKSGKRPLQVARLDCRHLKER